MDATKLFSTKIDRRRMLGNLGMMGAGAVLTACGTTMAKPPQETDYDAAILNFALNLEYLEAAFYLAAIGRLGDLPGYSADKILLPDGYTGLDPAQSLFPAVGPVSDPVAEYAQEIARDELEHVEFLRDALGTSAGDLPTIDLNVSFQTAAAAAFSFIADPSAVGLPAGFTPAMFNPFANAALFLHGAFIFEDVGVTAYKGAAKFITNPDTLEAAAGILAVEAYHAGTVRTYLYGADKRRADIFGGLDTWVITRAISDARDSLDGSTDLDQGIVGNAELDTQVHEGPDDVGANIVPTNDQGIAFSRTPRQVANIVLLTTDTSVATGGFFPNGLSVPANLVEQTNALLDPSFPDNLG